MCNPLKSTISLGWGQGVGSELSVIPTLSQNLVECKKTALHNNSFKAAV